jgi:hypothetical protein
MMCTQFLAVHDSTLAMGYDSTLAMGYDNTLAMGYDSTLAMGYDSTLAMGYDSTLAMGYDSSRSDMYRPTTVCSIHSLSLSHHCPLLGTQKGLPAFITSNDITWK